MMGVIGVSPFVYLSFAIVNWINLIIGILFGYLDFKITYIYDSVERN